MIFLTTCAGGLEKLVAKEVQEWGGNPVAAGAGVVRWTGELESGYRACLWSRFSSRVLLVLREFDCGSTEELYDQGRVIDWEEHVAKDGCFAVDCHLRADAVLHHSRYAALCLKDAIVDWFRDRTGMRPDVQLKRPDVRFHVTVQGHRGTIAVDLSGDSLHRRGYRRYSGEAPLKESLAAAIIALSGWDHETPLIDPLCGSGTLLIEAALIKGNSAPGLGRTYYGFQKWAGHQQDLWEGLVEEALALEEQGQQECWPPLFGYDGDPEMVAAARQNISRAGLEDHITIACRELAAFRGDGFPPGWIVCNPPYGERLSATGPVRHLYRFLGNRVRESFRGWHIALFTGKPEYADLLQITWHKTWRLYNGPLACGLFTAAVPTAEPTFFWQVRDVVEGCEEERDLVNRLKKNLEKRLPWARQMGIECFRVYDRDLPDYNVVVEIYRKWVFIHEYAAGKTVSAERADQRWKTVVHAVRSLLGVGRDRLFFSRNKREGELQRTKGGKRVEVGEGRARYLVELSPGGVKGLDLDQRSLRQHIHDTSAGKAFLNLADQAGCASVQAVLGGADRTVTIVATPEMAERTADNFALNGLYERNHSIVVSDCRHWLESARDRYGLIHFSIRPGLLVGGGKARFSPDDHGALIESAMRLLEPQGVLLFSVNLGSFSFDQRLNRMFSCRQRDRAFLPQDCERNSIRCHYWEIRHRDRVA